jgi:anhydro-N-acetylmuramic acid kinase
MRVIGMISGTSFDAIEAVAVELSIVDHIVEAEMLGHVSVPYSHAIRSRVAGILPPHTTTINEVCELDTLIGQSFADVAVQLSDRFFHGEPDVVCSHGQTVFHWVEDHHAKGTLQIGQGSWIAERTGATVVTDVRSRDVAAGGHGAPLVSLLDVLLLGTSPSTIRAALNLGGISNITVVGPTSDPIAFDIGPANALMDVAVWSLTEGSEQFDRDGERAERGVVDESLLEVLRADPYYQLAAPKSTGKEYFHLDYLQGLVGSRSINPDDLLATLNELTASTVADSVRQHRVTELFVSGGGTRNPRLMRRLRVHLANVPVTLIDELGISEAAKEAALFALIGFYTVHGMTGTIASCTGARHATVLGAVYPGRQPVVTLEPDEMPTRLRFTTKLKQSVKSD